jgi:TrbL/VirB6 plasmid conjugal transfer protein
MSILVRYGRRFSMIALALLVWTALCLPTANAQLVTPADLPAATGTAGSTASAATATAAISKPGELGQGSRDAVTQVASLLNNLIPAAVALSQKVLPEANKFAWGLAAITIVLAGVRFAGTHHPVSAWISVFEEIAVLGIFVALYLGYTTSAAGFWNWFVNLASLINSSDVTVPSQMATLGGTIFEALKDNYGVWGALTHPAAALGDAIILLLAFIVMTIAAIFYAYYTSVGQIQAALGIVLGPIALALGFSSYTRGYFQKWLDWMISAGMYVVVVAILMGLVNSSISSAFSKASGVGVHTTLNAAYVFDLAIFMLLLSLEIPKLAGIFGGGASASGTGGVRMAAKAATGGLF